MIILFITLCVILACYLMRQRDLVAVKSLIDGKYYQVQNRPDKQDAADKLAQLRIKFESFVDQVSTRDLNPHARKGMERLKRRYQSVFVENPPGGQYTSYTYNKGKRIHMCIRERNNKGEIEKDNTLVFVVLHELAHIMTLSVGHTPEFWDNFRFLLRQALDLGYYKYHAYHDDPVTYCGTDIVDTPLREGGLGFP
jgi:hypothetical protein